MTSITRISGNQAQNTTTDTSELFKAQLEKAFEKKIELQKSAEAQNNALKAFKAAMQHMQNEQPQETQKPKKPQKPKPDESKYRPLAEKMADQKGDGNGKVDTPQETADVEVFIKMLMAADPDAQQGGE